MKTFDSAPFQFLEHSGTQAVSGRSSSSLDFIREVSVQYRGQRRKKTLIRCAADAAAFVRRVLPDNSREHFVSLYLDGANHVAAFSVTATGSANSCPVHPREVFQNAVLVGAIAVVVAHNHPGGDTMPSTCDRTVTTRLAEAGNVLGIKLLDHIILGDNGYYSFEERENHKP